MCQPESFKSALILATVSLNESVAKDTFRMVLSVDRFEEEPPLPGQFIMLRVAPSEPLLARPFGVSGFQRAGTGAAFEIIYRVVGRGTGLMAGWEPGRRASFLGPLGEGFPLPPEGSSSLLVAGGVGLPPLLSLAREMDRAGRGGEVSLLYGEASSDRLIGREAEWFPRVMTATCTEDGSCGTPGLVTGLLEGGNRGEGRHLFVCGPNPMMKAVFEITRGRCLSSRYSLEARMACGFGVCSGCAVRLSSGGYVRVCREGPVFGGEDLCLDSFGEV